MEWWTYFVFLVGAVVGGVVSVAATGVGIVLGMLYYEKWRYVQNVVEQETKERQLASQLSATPFPRIRGAVVIPELRARIKVQSGSQRGYVNYYDIPWSVCVLKSNMLFQYRDAQVPTCQAVIPLDRASVKVVKWVKSGGRVCGKYHRKSAVRITAPGGMENGPSGSSPMQSSGDAWNATGSPQLLPGERVVYLYFSRGYEMDEWLHAIKKSVRVSQLSEEESRRSEMESMQFLHLGAILTTGEPASADWINGIMGRIVWAIHDNPFVLKMAKKGLQAKIDRMKKPTFKVGKVESITVQDLTLGPNMPVFSNVVLNNISSQGAFSMDLDVLYHGGFRFRLDIVLAFYVPVARRTILIPVTAWATVLCVAGRVNFRIAPPPSVRCWIGFYGLPRVDVDIRTEVGKRDSNFVFRDLPAIARVVVVKVKEKLLKKFVLPTMEDFPIPHIPKKFTQEAIAELRKAEPVPAAFPRAAEGEETSASSSSATTAVDAKRAKGAVDSASAASGAAKAIAAPAVAAGAPSTPTERRSSKADKIAADKKHPPVPKKPSGAGTKALPPTPAVAAAPASGAGAQTASKDSGAAAPLVAVVSSAAPSTSPPLATALAGTPAGVAAAGAAIAAPVVSSGSAAGGSGSAADRSSGSSAASAGVRPAAVERPLSPPRREDLAGAARAADASGSKAASGGRALSDLSRMAMSAPVSASALEEARRAAVAKQSAAAEAAPVPLRTSVTTSVTIEEDGDVVGGTRDDSGGDEPSSPSDDGGVRSPADTEVAEDPVQRLVDHVFTRASADSPKPSSASSRQIAAAHPLSQRGLWVTEGGASSFDSGRDRGLKLAEARAGREDGAAFALGQTAQSPTSSGLSDVLLLELSQAAEAAAKEMLGDEAGSATRSSDSIGAAEDAARAEDVDATPESPLESEWKDSEPRAKDASLRRSAIESVKTAAADREAPPLPLAPPSGQSRWDDALADLDMDTP